MSKRTLFTTITPLPHGLSRDAAVSFLHNHLQMIDLNPLIKERRKIPPPAHSSHEERSCTWYSLTDKVSYLPGGLASGDVTYTCAFHNLPRGLQTHCYAPMGVETRSKWSVGGSMPGEPFEPVELGLGAPASGLYLREDVDLRCNIILASFVKKTIKKSHSTLVDRLSEVAERHAKGYYYFHRHPRGQRSIGSRGALREHDHQRLYRLHYDGNDDDAWNGSTASLPSPTTKGTMVFADPPLRPTLPPELDHGKPSSVPSLA